MGRVVRSSGEADERLKVYSLCAASLDALQYKIAIAARGCVLPQTDEGHTLAVTPRMREMFAEGQRARTTLRAAI